MGKRSHSNDYRQNRKQKNDKKQQRIQNNKIKFITSQYKKQKTPEKKKKKISEKIYQQKKNYKNQKHKYNYKEKQIKYNKYHKIDKEIQRNQQINTKNKKQKQKQIKKEKEKNQKQKQKQKSKSPSPSVQIQNNQQINEKARARKLAMRKVKARLLKLNDILNSDDSDDDDSDRQKDKNKNQKNIQPPPVPQIITPIKPKIGKRVSKWNVISANQPILPRIQEQVINRQPEIKEKNLSLEIQASEDLLKLSEDKSIEVEDPNINTEIINENQSKQIDPLDEYLLQMEGKKVDHMIVQAVKQVQLPKRGDNVITFEDIMAEATVEPQQSLQQQNNLLMENDDKFQIQFMQAIKNWQQKKQIDDKGIMMQNNQDKQSDISNFQQQPQTQLDFFAKQRKMAQRKQLNQIDHSIIKYQEVKFNLYRQAQQVKNQNIKQIIKYRKQAGDIKIRGKNIINPIINWFQCGFNDRILNVIQKRNYHKPFPIQEQSLPLIMSGRDMIGIAETGSGKTLAYLLPVLKHITNQRIVQQGQGPISIIMTPTRELARQVYLEAKHFCKCMNVRVIAVYGGLSIQTQLSELRRGAELVICTPGRMIDILTLNKGKITNLRRVTLVVLDEADRMFDLGFEPQITRIIDNIRPKRQVVMFSATFPKNVQNLARRTLNDPVEVIVGGRGQACRNVEQIVEVRQDNTKFLRLLQILGLWNEQGSILIFIDKQTEADYLFHELLKYGYHSLVLHGAMDPDDREFTIYDFKKRIKNILIATSICARGLDIKSIILVVNFKCPNHLEDYIHRIGRTGRAGNKGTAITFITSTQQQYSIDLIKALEMAEVRPPEQLIKLSQSYLSKVKKGQARKIRNRNIQGSGFKFDQEEEEKTNQIKDMLKKQLKSEGIGAFEDSDEDDIEMKKKKEEDIRGRNQQDRIAQAIKNPQIKNKLLNQAVKAVSEAIKNGSAMTTQKLLEIAVGSMKQSVTKHKVVRTVDDGVEQVTKLINQFQNKIGGQNSQHFSYDYEINDYPLGARQKACNQSFLHGIQNQTNCTISLRGVYVEPTKKAPVGCRKLYLHIQGANKYYVNTAYKEIKIVLEQSAYQNMHMGVIPGKYAICN